MTPQAVDWQGGLSDAWATIADFVPRLIFFFVILIIGWLIAKALAKITNAVLERVGFDRAVEQGGIKQALARSKYDASDIVAKLVKYAIMLLTLVLAFNVFGPNPISALLQQVVWYIPRIIVAIVIIVVAAAIARVVKDLIGSMLGGLSYGNALATIASVFIMFLGVIAALNQVGVATSVTTPVLITILATIGGVIVVGAGGGLIRPMQSRWERWLNRAELEGPAMRTHIQSRRAGTSTAGYDQGGAAYDDAGDSYRRGATTEPETAVDLNSTSATEAGHRRR